MAETAADRDAALLLDMLLAARDASTFVVGMDLAAFMASRLHQNAVIRSLEIVGEAAGKVSPATQALHPEIPWREITGMRHRLIHGYAEVRLNLVWAVVEQHLGPLIAVLEPLIPEEGAPEP
ncbi:MAG: HepT-like ribonuclease domain-containing protein [Rhodospirillales bacterium]